MSYFFSVSLDEWGEFQVTSALDETILPVRARLSQVCWVNLHDARPLTLGKTPRAIQPRKGRLPLYHQANALPSEYVVLTARLQMKKISFYMA